MATGTAEPPSNPSDLLGVSKELYGEGYAAHLLEQYKLYVQMADKISDRRQSANSFFLTLNTALVAALAALISHRPTWLPTATYIVICFCANVLCFSWYLLIGSYRDLNSGKFKVIHEIEQHLPIRPYVAEWSTVGRGRIRALYFPFTHAETGIPFVFILLYLGIILVLLFSDMATRGTLPG